MHTRKRTAALWRLIASLAVIALLAAACGDDDDSGADGTSATDADGGTTDGGADADGGTADDGADGDGCTEEHKGGQLTLAQPVFTRGLDPFVALGSAVAGANETTALYDTLLRFNPESGEYEPHLAESFDHNEDSTEWTVVLRDGPTFGNGDPVDAAAVQFSMERMRTSTTNSGALASLIAETEVVDDRTVVFHLSAPWGTFPYVLAEEAGMIVNPNVVAEVGDEQMATNPPPGAGSGPYVLERFAEGEELVLTAKDDYWGGPVCIDSIRILSVLGGQATYDAFKTGELQMAMVNDDQVRAEAEAEGVEGYSTPGGMGTLLAFNSGRNPGAAGDVRVREAVTLALDLDLLNERAYGGAAHMGASLMPQDSPIFPGDGPAYDPDRATEIVDELKAEGFDGKIRLHGGDDPASVELVITIEALLETVGFDVDARSVDRTEANRLYIDEGDYDLALTGPVLFEESTVVDLSQLRSDSTSNRMGYANPEMDAAVDAMTAATNREETIAALSEIQGIWNEDFPAALMIDANWWWAIDPSVQGITWSRDMTPMFHDAYLAN